MGPVNKKSFGICHLNRSHFQRTLPRSVTTGLGRRRLRRLVVIRQHPEVPGPVLGLVPLAEVRVHGQVVADGVLPAVVLHLEERVAVTENTGKVC